MNNLEMTKRYLELRGELIRRLSAMPEDTVKGPIKILYYDDDLKYRLLDPGETFTGKYIAWDKGNL